MAFIDVKDPDAWVEMINGIHKTLDFNFSDSDEFNKLCASTKIVLDITKYLLSIWKDCTRNV